MKTKFKLMAVALIAGGTMFAQTRLSIGVGVGSYGPGYYPPPSYGDQYVPPCPGPDYTWVDGYWAPQGGRNVDRRLLARSLRPRLSRGAPLRKARILRFLSRLLPGRSQSWLRLPVSESRQRTLRKPWWRTLQRARPRLPPLTVPAGERPALSRRFSLQRPGRNAMQLVILIFGKFST